jgi:hypothetical protein
MGSSALPPAAGGATDAPEGSIAFADSGVPL